MSRRDGLTRRSGGPVGEIRGARSTCRNCGRPLWSPPGAGMLTFCSVSCFERYPKDACASMAMQDLVMLVAARRPRSETEKLKTRADLEAVAVAVLTEEPADVMNANPEGYSPWYVLTRQGADKASYDKGRVEPQGKAPVMALAAERAYVLAKGGGLPTLPESMGGGKALPPEVAERMARTAVAELPAEALETMAGFLGEGPAAKETLNQLGSGRAMAAHERVHAAQLPPAASQSVDLIVDELEHDYEHLCRDPYDPVLTATAVRALLPVVGDAETLLPRYREFFRRCEAQLRVEVRSARMGYCDARHWVLAHPVCLLLMYLVDSGLEAHVVRHWPSSLPGRAMVPWSVGASGLPRLRVPT